MNHETPAPNYKTPTQHIQIQQARILASHSAARLLSPLIKASMLPLKPSLLQAPKPKLLQTSRSLLALRSLLAPRSLRAPRSLLAPSSKLTLKQSLRKKLLQFQWWYLTVAVPLRRPIQPLPIRTGSHFHSPICQWLTRLLPVPTNSLSPAHLHLQWRTVRNHLICLFSLFVLIEMNITKKRWERSHGAINRVERSLGI
jgi:hypothetical protein